MSRLVYSEYDGRIHINYSGYTFTCVLSRSKQDKAPKCKLAEENTVEWKDEDIETTKPLHQRPLDKRELFSTQLKGRTIIGALPIPSYNITKSGKVVVKIKIDRNGTVVEAQPGEAGTTLQNKDAWEAAKKAALKAQFNMKADAPEFQYGTITYIFNTTNQP